MSDLVASERQSIKKRAKASSKRVRPPFGYFGSKNKLAIQIAKSLPPHNAWVEAFCGSAAVTLAKKASPIEVINDIDGQIVNVFRQLRDHPQKLCKLIALTPYSREELMHSRGSGSKEVLPIEQARRFLVSSMMAINGAFGAAYGGFSYSQSYARGGCEARVNRWYKLPDRLYEVVERLRHVRVEKKDAIKLLKMFIDKPATLVYLDPPYLVERKNGYNIDANDAAFHKRLLKTANRARCMVLISGYDNDLYGSMLKPQNGWTRKIIKTYTKAAKGRRHARKEVLWGNRYFSQAEKLKRAPLQLTKREQKLGKINPSRKKKRK